MNPQQPEPPRGQYDFIVNPNYNTPQKSGGLKSVGQNSFLKFIGILIGGAVLLVVVGLVLANVFLADKTNVNELVTLTQYQTEIIRLTGTKSTPATTQAVRNASITTELTTTTHMQQTIKFLSQHGRKVPKGELNLKASATVDQQLKLAQETSTFDSTFSKIMREDLTEYARAIAIAHDHALSGTEKSMLSNQYDETQMLLKQWPE